jgi:hypothetical protein
MSLLRNLCSFLVFTRSADRLTPTAAEAPQAREARGLSFFRAIGTVDRSERYSGLRTPTPPVPPHGVRSEPPPLQDGGFFLCTVNAHLLISIVGTGEGDDLPEHSSDVDRSVTCKDLALRRKMRHPLADQVFLCPSLCRHSACWLPDIFDSNA